MSEATIVFPSRNATSCLDVGPTSLCVLRELNSFKLIKIHIGPTNSNYNNKANTFYNVCYQRKHLHNIILPHCQNQRQHQH